MNQSWVYMCSPSWTPLPPPTHPILLGHPSALSEGFLKHVIGWGFPGGSEGKETTCNQGVPGLIPVLGRCFGDGNGNPLQYSCLESPMDRGAWQATVPGVTKNQTHWVTNTGCRRRWDNWCYHICFSGKIIQSAIRRPDFKRVTVNTDTS